MHFKNYPFCRKEIFFSLELLNLLVQQSYFFILGNFEGVCEASFSSHGGARKKIRQETTR